MPVFTRSAIQALAETPTTINGAAQAYHVGNGVVYPPPPVSPLGEAIVTHEKLRKGGRAFLNDVKRKLDHVLPNLYGFAPGPNGAWSMASEAIIYQQKLLEVHGAPWHVDMYVANQVVDWQRLSKRTGWSKDTLKRLLMDVANLFHNRVKEPVLSIALKNIHSKQFMGTDTYQGRIPIRPVPLSTFLRHARWLLGALDEEFGNDRPWFDVNESANILVHFVHGGCELDVNCPFKGEWDEYIPVNP